MGNSPSTLNTDEGHSQSDQYDEDSSASVSARSGRQRRSSRNHDSSTLTPLRTSNHQPPAKSSRNQKDVAIHYPHQHRRYQSHDASRSSLSKQQGPQQKDALAIHNTTPSVAQPQSVLESASARHTSQSSTSAADILKSQSQSTTSGRIPSFDTAPSHRTSSSRGSSRRSSLSSAFAMGQNESRIKGPAKDSGGSAGTASPAATSRPIDVSASHKRKTEPVPQLTEDESSYMLPLPNFGRPPRLPLPIKGSVHAPGSPILSPAGLDEPIEYIGDLPRRSSILSSTTLDDSESDNGDDLNTVRGGVLPPVPTTVEWREDAPGNKVYVTGTFADWDNKYKLTRREDGVYALTLNLQPGTYHLRFIVNGEMVLSSHLPTAVDFTNCLVNYLEVIQEIPSSIAGKEPFLPPHLQQEQLQEQQQQQKLLDQQEQEQQQRQAQKLEQQQQAVTQPIPFKRPHVSHTPSGTPVPQAVPPTPELAPVTVSSSVPPEPTAPVTANLSLQLVPERRYTTTTPQFFQDVEADADTSEDAGTGTAPEDYWRSAELSQALPTPPSLPGFLTKSIHNMHTPIKDDASVLANPNHTVLNHLTTSSIKGGVIATSMTTRYGRKFLTTILYKPTQPND